jgi:four helix bundle protein
MNVTKLEDDKLWQKVAHIAEAAYGLLTDFPEEEKWGLTSKVRQRAFEASNDVAEGLGAIDPRDIKWHFGLARRDLFGLKNALLLGTKAGYLDVNPEMMSEIEQSIQEIDSKIAEAGDAIPAWFNEMQPPEKIK